MATIDDERKTGLLTLTKLKRVAFVNRGANQLARISLVKSADVDPDNRVTDKKIKPEGKETVVTASQQLEKKALEIRKSDGSLTFAQAAVRAQNENRDLVDEYYDKEFGNEPEPVEKTEPEPTEFEKADADIITIQKTHGEDSREYAVAMAKRLELLGHEAQAEDWRAQAAFI